MIFRLDPRIFVLLVGKEKAPPCLRVGLRVLRILTMTFTTPC